MLNMAVLGCGRIGRMHARNIALNAATTLVAVYDPDAAAAQAVAQQTNARVATDITAILDNHLVDAVLIATPTSTHAYLIEAFAKAGKAVLCEKPVDLALARVERLKATLSGITTPVQIGFNRRFDPGHRAACKSAREGEIGTLVQVIITSRDPALPSRNYLETAGGFFRDMSIHDLDLARFLLPEEPVEVFAVAGALVDPDLGRELDEIDTAMITLQTASGVMAQINNTRCAVYGYDQRVELVGTQGMVISTNQRAHELLRFGPGKTESREPNLEFFIERYAHAFEAQITAFARAVENGIAPEVGLEDGRRALILAEAAYRSLATGRKVHVSEIAP